MKKIIFSAVLATAVFISFNSCKKVATTSPGTTSSSPVAQQLNICPLSNVTTSSYSVLGTSLFGGGNGQGTSGPIDNKLNCNQSAGTLCNNVTSPDIMVASLTEDVTSGWHCLSDGVMTTTEQQTLINQIQNTVNSHMVSTYGSTYQVTNYDVWFTTALCGGCPDGILVMVKYKAGRPCR